MDSCTSCEARKGKCGSVSSVRKSVSQFQCIFPAVTLDHRWLLAV